MATTTETKKTTAKTTTTKKATAPVKAESAPAEEKVKVVAKDVDLNEIIPVKNGFNGKLVYVSKKTGEEYQWDGFGEVQDIDLRELRNIKSSAKGFFENNYFMFDEEYDWVIDFLGVRQFYKNAISIDEFDTLLDESIDTIVSTIDKMSKGQKKSFSYHVREKILNDEIDSNKLIAALEKALNTEFVER